MEEVQNPPAEEAKVEFPEHGAVFEGEHGAEVIVHDTDKEGNVVGWHKELKQEEGDN